VAHVTNPNKHPPERAWLQWLEESYGKLLEVAIRFRWLTALLSFAVLVAALILAKTAMTFQLFPPVGVEEYIVRVIAPPGTSLKTMRKNLRAIDKDMRAMIDPSNLEATLLVSGDISVDEGDQLTQRGSRYGQIRAIYSPAVGRGHHDALDDMYNIAKVLVEKYPALDISTRYV
jgi:multidrug efflux pump subunit AcrB